MTYRVEKYNWDTGAKKMKTKDDIVEIMTSTVVNDTVFKGLIFTMTYISMTNIAYDMIMKGEY